MATARLAFDTQTTQGELSLTVTLDAQTKVQRIVNTEIAQIAIDFDDDVECDHCLEITMSGKTSDDTKIDDQGNILSDKLLRITNITLDGIAIHQLVSECAVYRHDFNGTTDPQQDKFYDTMGCRGTVTMAFRSPVYLWLLENM